MHPPLDMETVGRLEIDAETPEEQRALTARLVPWADERRPDDSADVTPAALLIEAGQILEGLGDLSQARDLFHRATTAEGPVSPDALAYLHRALLSTGDLPGARRITGRMRRSRSLDAASYVMVGETYEKAGDLQEAHRWMNLGLRRLHRQIEDGDTGAAGVELLVTVIVRARVRRAMSLPRDAEDRLAASITGRARQQLVSNI